MNSLTEGFNNLMQEGVTLPFMPLHSITGIRWQILGHLHEVKWTSLMKMICFNLELVFKKELHIWPYYQPAPWPDDRTCNARQESSVSGDVVCCEPSLGLEQWRLSLSLEKNDWIHPWNGYTKTPCDLFNFIGLQVWCSGGPCGMFEPENSFFLCICYLISTTQFS